ncbi:T9SS type A sorting domain-containing protein [Mucilaginibacter sp. BJC16-A38]|uniref:LamG-like jellyroll fold domain-containing protein n=1 Tax=Mucilaginibacter phenanthrenivorans TaxID=1234842 RepID=UPI00215809A5|nr:LamG-like jellyroll fold domain-containing protein [Mucilaginibacter phenanthrenivorans]MCR8557688.1 T9SS type A sorting domain-containing protein [Mucilaginibacter phenanthrenivorans]
MENPSRRYNNLSRFFCALILILFVFNSKSYAQNTVSITSPSADIIFTIGSSFTATAQETATFGYTFSTMTFSVDGGTGVTATMAGTVGSKSISTTGLSYGVHTLTAKATFNYFLGGTNSVTSSVTFLVKPAQPSITTGSYGFSIPITLKMSSTGVSTGASLTTFPALVYIQSDSLKIGKVCGDKVQFPTGNGGGATAGTNYDFAFTETGLTTELYYQVDTYDSVNGILLAWVQVPALTKADKTLTFYFGSASPSHSAAFAASTWPSDYLAVYHFSEGSATATVLDATLHARNAVQAHTAVTNDEIHVAAGIPTTGGAYTFNGTNTSIIQNTGTFPDCTGQFTVSAWVTYTGTSTSDNKLVSDQLDYSHGYKLSVRNSTIETETRTTANPSPGNVWDAGTPVTPNTWSYVQGEFNGSAFMNYLNGIYATGGAFKAGTSGTNSPPEAGNYLTMGLDHGTGAANGGYDDAWFFSGVMDEVRVSNIAKSADWIQAEYYNQKNPKTFTVCTAVATNLTNAQTLNAGAVICTWTGASGTGLTTAANWDLGAPDLSTGKTSLVIPAVGTGVYPKLTASASIYGLTIADGASIDLNGQTLNVGCNIINEVTTGGKGILDATILTGITSGNLNSSTGVVNWNGSLASQTYKSTANVATTAQMSNMTISNTNAGPGTITLTGGPVEIYNLLKLTQGNLLIDNTNNGALTLKANTTTNTLNYAEIETIPSPYTIKGNIKYEVYYTGGAGWRNYRSMASPVYDNTTTYSATNGTYKFLNYKTSFIITGFSGSTNNFDNSWNFGSTIRTYNSATNNYTFLGTLSASQVIATGSGFFMYFRGDRTHITGATTADPFGSKTNKADGGGSYAIPEGVTYTYTGIPNQGNVSTNMVTGTSSAYYLIANPYAATLDANALLASSKEGATSVYFTTRKVWVWKPSSSAQYAIWDATNPTASPNGANSSVLPGQGFFVQAANPTTTYHILTITESMKSTSTNNNTFRNLSVSEPVAAAPEPPILRLKLSKDAANSDEIGMVFRDSTKAIADADDAVHFEGDNLTLSSLSDDGQYLAIDKRPFTGKKTIVPLYVTGNLDTAYTIQLSYTSTLMKNYKVTLFDSLLNTKTVINSKAYSFNIINSQHNTYAKRFKLIIEPLPVPALFTKFTGKVDEIKKVMLNWTTLNQRGSIFYQVQKSTDKKVFTNIGDPLVSLMNPTDVNYQSIDNSPGIGINYYRLIQTDQFNNRVYSDTVAIAFNPGLVNGIAKNGFILYTNPVKDVLQIVSDKSYTSKVTMDIYDSLGNLKYTQTYSSMDAQQPIQENVSKLKVGVYIIHLKSNNKELVTLKFSKEQS